MQSSLRIEYDRKMDRHNHCIVINNIKRFYRRLLFFLNSLLVIMTFLFQGCTSDGGNNSHDTAEPNIESASSQLSNSEDIPINEMFVRLSQVDEEKVDLSYIIDTNQGIVIKPKSRNYNGLSLLERVEIPLTASFDYTESVSFPELDLFIQNSSGEDWTIESVNIVVKKSELNNSICIFPLTEHSKSNSITIINDGITHIDKLNMRFSILKKNEDFNGKYEFSKAINFNGDIAIVNLENELASLGYNATYVDNNYGFDDEDDHYALVPADECSNPNELFYPFEWVDDEYTYNGFARIIGEIFDSRGHTIYKFSGKISLSSPDGFGGVYDYDNSYDVVLQSDNENYTVQLPYHKVIRAGQHGRIKFKLFCEKSTTHFFHIEAIEQGNHILKTKPITLIYYYPTYALERRPQYKENL